MPSSSSAAKKWKSKNVTADCPRIPFAPGMELTQGRTVKHGAYCPVSFGSKREYEDDSEGWTTVKKVGKRKRRTVRSDAYLAAEHYLY